MSEISQIDKGTLVPVRRTPRSSREMTDILFRQAPLITMALAAIVGFAVAYVLLSPSRYRSQMTLLVQAQRTALGLGSDNARSGPPGMEVTDSQLATVMQLLSSSEILGQVVDKCGLAEGRNGSPVELRARTRAKLAKSIKITPAGKADLITVSYVGYSPDQAAGVLQTLVNVYLDQHLKIHEASGNYQFFRSQADYFQDEWHQAQARMAVFQHQTNVIALDEQKDLGIRKLNDIETSLRETQSALSEAAHREEALVAQLSAATPRIKTQERTVPNQYAAERLNTMIVELTNRRTELLTKFRPDNRLIQEVDQQIAQTQSALKQATDSQAKEEASDVNPVRQTLESQLLEVRATKAGLQGRTETLSGQLARFGKRIGQLGDETENYEQLTRQIKEAEANYLLFSRQSEEARISDEMDQKRMANVMVVDGPERPVFAESKLSLNVVFGLLSGLILVIVLAFVRGIRRTQVFTPWELEGVVGVPVLGTVTETS